MLQRHVLPLPFVAICVLVAVVAVVAVFAVVALAWARAGPEITSKLDHDADFTGFRTYGVVEAGTPMSAAARDRGRGSAKSNDARRLDQGEQAIRDTIIESLRSRGYEPNRDGNPDFYIGYDALVLRFDDPLTRPSQLIRQGWGGSVAVQRSYSIFDSGAAYEGRLTIFVVDARTRQIIWSTTAEGDVRNLRNIVNEAHEVVLEMMSRMPAA